MAERILQANRVDVAIGPQTLGADTTVSSGWFSMREWAELAAVLLLNGVLVAGETVTLALRQATSAAGAGAKALASKVVTAGAAAGNLLLSFDPGRRAVITLDTVVETDAVTVGETTLVFVAADPGAGEVLLGSDDEDAATNLAAAIDAIEGFSAAADGAVVTVVGADVEASTSDTTITIVLSAVADGDEIEVNGETLTFKAVGTGTGGAAAAGEVLLGADDDDAAANLADAISALPGLSAVEDPASVAVSAAVPAGVTVDLGDTTIAAGTTEDIVTLGLDVSALDTNAGFAFVQVQATASGAGLTGAATLLRGGGRVAVRQDV